jgi:uncharacterized membrane protein
MTQPPDDHLKALWQGQETETKPMSVEAIRTRAARYTTRRRWTFLLGFTVALVEIVVFGHYVLVIPNTVARIGLLVILVGLGWMIARLSVRWPGKVPGAMASGGSILEFHRIELQRHPETFGALMILAGPMLLGVVIFAAAGVTSGPHPSAMKGAPILALLAFWLIVAWWSVRRAERNRQRRLAEIEATRVEPD